jgi:DNA modification methylase
MKTYLHLSKTFDENLPSEFRDDDVRFPESLVSFFLEEYTRAGDVVLDPFAGYGTTLRVAERMGRVPLGIEINAQKANYIRTQLQNPTSLIHGDARRLGEMGLPRIDFSITSPPYMSLGDLEDPG